VPGVDVDSDNATITPNPEAARVDRRVQDALGLSARIEIEKSLEKLGVGSVPNGRKGLICPGVDFQFGSREERVSVRPTTLHAELAN
jgi:hypothetical protein